MSLVPILSGLYFLQIRIHDEYCDKEFCNFLGIDQRFLLLWADKLYGFIHLSEWAAEGESSIFGGVEVKKINTRKQRCL